VFFIIAAAHVCMGKITWGRTGFDGDAKTWIAGSVADRSISRTYKLKNNNSNRALALAA